MISPNSVHDRYNAAAKASGFSTLLKDVRNMLQCMHDHAEAAKVAAPAMSDRRAAARQAAQERREQEERTRRAAFEPKLALLLEKLQRHAAQTGDNRDLEDAQRDDFHVCKCGGDKVFCPAEECLSLACMECDDGLDEGFSPCFCCDQSHCDRHSGKECVVCEEPFCDECISTCSSCQQPVCPKHESVHGRQCLHSPNPDSADSADSDDPSRKRRKTLFA